MFGYTHNDVSVERGSKPLHPFAVILVSIIRTTIMKAVVEEEKGPGGRQIGEPLYS